MVLSIMYRFLIAAAGLHRYQCESYTSQNQNYLVQGTRICGNGRDDVFYGVQGVFG